MQSTIAKRSINVAGHQTSVSLEDAFWNGLKEIGKRHNRTLSELIGDIDGRRQCGNLSSAIRLFVLDQFRARPYGLNADARDAGQQTAQYRGKAPLTLQRAGL
jgi:predicted DNA-binding ribbon-helix-helix protein